MNKFKKILLGTLSVLTLGLFVATEVSAAVNNSFTFDLSKFEKIGKNSIGETSSTATDATSEDTMTLTLNIPTALTGSDSKWDSSNNCYIVGIKSDGTNATFTLSFTMQGTGNATFDFNTGGGSKYVDLSVDGGTTTQIANGGTGTKVVSNLTKGSHTFTFTGTNSSSSNFKLYSFIVTDSYETGTPAEQAIAAINDIPNTIAYTDECKGLIDAAAAKIAKVENTEDITNLETYTLAVSSFNTLSTNAKNTFINSVNVADITTISASSKQALKTATTNYNNLIDSDKLDTDVISAKATLDEKQAEYSATYEKIMSITIDDIDDVVKTNAAISSDTVLTVSSKDTIFSATTGVKIEDTNSGKTYEKVSYKDRFKTSGTIQIINNKVNCALKIDAPSSGTIELLALSGNSNSLRNIKLCKVVNNALVTVKDLGNVAQKSTLDKFSFNIYEAGTYYIGSDTVETEENATAGGINIYKVSFTECDFIDSTVTATLYKQFDKNTNPTMLRLMGKIEGIAYADYENISNVLMEFDFNNGTTTTSKSAYCYKLYKSIKTLDGSLDADEDGKTMYVVLTISGLEKYSSMSFTNVKMTITFGDGSTKEATHTNF